MQLLCLKFIIYDLTPLKLCFKLIHPASLRCNYHFHPRQSQRLSFPKDIILRTMGSVEETMKCRTATRHTSWLLSTHLSVFTPGCPVRFSSWDHQNTIPNECALAPQSRLPSVCLSPFVQATTSLRRKQNHLFLETRTESHTAPTTMSPSHMSLRSPGSHLTGTKIVLCSVSSKQTWTNNKNPLTMKEQQKPERERN